MSQDPGSSTCKYDDDDDDDDGNDDSIVPSINFGGTQEDLYKKEDHLV